MRELTASLGATVADAEQRSNLEGAHVPPVAGRCSTGVDRTQGLVDTSSTSRRAAPRGSTRRLGDSNTAPDLSEICRYISSTATPAGHPSRITRLDRPPLQALARIFLMGNERLQLVEIYRYPIVGLDLFPVGNAHCSVRPAERRRRGRPGGLAAG